MNQVLECLGLGAALGALFSLGVVFFNVSFLTETFIFMRTPIFSIINLSICVVGFAIVFNILKEKMRGEKKWDSEKNQNRK